MSDEYMAIPASRDEIAKIQSERKKIALQKARKANFHKGRLDNIDEDKLDDPDEWRKIPLLDKDELRSIPPERFFDDFCHAPREKIAELWRSGGSTGIPLFYPRTFEDLPYCLLSFARNFIAPNLGKKDTAQVSFPLGIHPVGHVYARACQEQGIGVNWAGAGNSTPSAVQIDLINRLQPSTWMGMSSYGIHLANMAEDQGIDLAGSSVETIMTSAEPMSAAKRDKISRMWGAEVWDGFGMTECGMMGGEAEARDGFHIWSDLFHIEVIDLDTGEPVAEGEEGGLVVTPLFTNNATPFIRWSSGDIVTYKEFGDSDGPLSVFPVIKHAHRTVGFFKVRGVNINHPELEDFLFEYEDLVDFKAEIVTEDDLDHLRLSVEVLHTGSPGELAR
ncbi:MAG: AMP-binding protein, partial [Rhodospirillaceae bacterium]|nr:AMP-binding protein [Rhodospirillaceae bacterium]